MAVSARRDGPTGRARRTVASSFCVSPFAWRAFMIRIFRSMLTFSAAARAREPSSELGETAARKGHQRGGGQEAAAWAALLKPSSPVASSSFRARCPGPDFCALPPPPTATARARVSRRQRLERRGGGSRGLTFLLGRGRAAAAAPTAAAAPLPHDHRLPVLVRPLSRRAERGYRSG